MLQLRITLTSTGLPVVNWRTSSERFKSQSNTCPSDEADIRALKDRDTASIVTADLCPNKQVFGSKSTALGVITSPQTEIVQSEPAVTRVFESANRT